MSNNQSQSPTSLKVPTEVCVISRHASVRPDRHNNMQKCIQLYIKDGLKPHIFVTREEEKFYIKTFPSCKIISYDDNNKGRSDVNVSDARNAVLKWAVHNNKSSIIMSDDDVIGFDEIENTKWTTQLQNVISAENPSLVGIQPQSSLRTRKKKTTPKNPICGYQLAEKPLPQGLVWININHWEKNKVMYPIISMCEDIYFSYMIGGKVCEIKSVTRKHPKVKSTTRTDDNCMLDKLTPLELKAWMHLVDSNVVSIKKHIVYMSWVPGQPKRLNDSTYKKNMVILGSLTESCLKKGLVVSDKVKKVSELVNQQKEQMISRRNRKRERDHSPENIIESITKRKSKYRRLN